jgi:hypothetical protein
LASVAHFKINHRLRDELLVFFCGVEWAVFSGEEGQNVQNLGIKNFFFFWLQA